MYMDQVVELEESESEATAWVNFLPKKILP